SSLNVQPHYFAGYEGGAKALLPGCSGLKTITINHGNVIGNPGCRELMIKGNLLREDMNEVPGILKDFMKIEHRILDFVYNQNGIGSEAFRREMETYGKMEPSAIVEDLKKRAKAGKVTEASQKPNRFALDDPKADFLVVSPKAPSAVEEFLGKTRIRFYRTIDDALRSLDSKLYDRDVAIVPYGSATVPLSS